MTTLGERMRAMGDALREAREQLACRIEDAEQAMAAWRDGEVQVTPRTKLLLRAGRLFLCRPERDPIGFADACRREAADVPGWILLAAAQRVHELRGARP